MKFQSDGDGDGTGGAYDSIRSVQDGFSGLAFSSCACVFFLSIWCMYSMIREREEREGMKKIEARRSRKYS